jgi:hypothetical protein
MDMRFYLGSIKVVYSLFIKVNDTDGELPIGRTRTFSEGNWNLYFYLIEENRFIQTIELVNSHTLEKMTLDETLLIQGDKISFIEIDNQNIDNLFIASFGSLHLFGNGFIAFPETLPPDIKQIDISIFRGESNYEKIVFNIM